MKTVFFSLFTLLGFVAPAQTTFSIGTDVSLMRNFSPQQKFFAIGQTIIVNLHFNNRETGYAWLGYYTPGKFSNNFTAVARSPFTVPSSINYHVNGRWTNKEVSIGLQHYFKGAYNAEYGWSLYSRTGFGLMFTKAENTFDPVIDTSLYRLPATPIAGTDEFKRLTLDLGIGTEIPLGGSFYFYSDIRTWIPMSDYPSPLLHNKKKCTYAFNDQCRIANIF